MSVFYMYVGKILQQANTLPTRWIKVHKKYMFLSAGMRTAKRHAVQFTKTLRNELQMQRIKQSILKYIK